MENFGSVRALPVTASPAAPPTPLTAAIDDLCEELRAQAVLLVDGLGVPEQWLQAAML